MFQEEILPQYMPQSSSEGYSELLKCSNVTQMLTLKHLLEAFSVLKLQNSPPYLGNVI